MSDAYLQLLEAAIQHLEEMKADGVRFVSVSPQNVAALSQGKPEPHWEKTVIAQIPVVPPAPKPPVPFSASALRRPEPMPTPEPAPPSIIPSLTPEAKMAAFADLRQRAMACVKCPNLAAARKNVVFGVGTIDAELMFVGEAPGADEDIQGEPFVGKAGQLLTKIIETMGLRRDSVYIANILKCRPDTPGQASGNRKTTPEEMQTCIPFLHEQIDLIRPKVLVA